MSGLVHKAAYMIATDYYHDYMQSHMPRFDNVGFTCQLLDIEEDVLMNLVYYILRDTYKIQLPSK